MPETNRTHADWIGRTVYDRQGDKVGDITDIYYDDRTGRPEWMTVSTGWFGTKEQFVPISGSSSQGEDIRVDFDTNLIKDAPGVDADDARISEDEERRLYRHYGFDAEAPDPDAMYAGRSRADEGFDYYDRRDTGTAVDTGTGRTGTETSTTLGEERLSVDKTERAAGTARLHKYVVTEDVNVTVPVKKQVARLVREPASGTAGAVNLGEDTEEVTLMEEEVNVSKQAVARERVGLQVDEVTKDRAVHDTVRREEVEVEGDVSGDTRR